MHEDLRSEIIAKLEALIDKRVSRDKVDRWARAKIQELEFTGVDRVLWKALNHLYGCDMPSTDREYLHDEKDFKLWLAEIKSYEGK